MNPKQDLRFEGFKLDRRNQELRRDARLIPLRPKTFAVLQYLAENPARLIPHEELLKAVWGPIAVGGGLLRGYIHELRQSLGDDAENPRFIETMPRRGFRFLPKVTLDSAVAVAVDPIPAMSSAPAPELVGRDQELRDLNRLIGSALGGKRQVVFIAGEAGIGKTALLNAFLRQARAAGLARVVCGQCVEQYGTREAYLPVFDALGRLCNGEYAAEAFAVLTRHAPSWLVQMPGLLSGDQFQNLQKRVQGTQVRMLGEFCEALEAFAEDQPFIFGLEDLQWTDLATLNLLSNIARREQRARLMVIGTYRPADVIISAHPLRAVLHDLLAHGQCSELWPGSLPEAGIETYLAHRFPEHAFAANLKQLIRRNTAGNPLFVTAIVDELVRDKLIESRNGQWLLTVQAEKLDAWKSASLRQLIEGQLSRLPAREQRLLEAAATVGAEFASDLLTGALEIDPVEVEERCDGLVRRRQVIRMAPEGFVQTTGEHPRYEFLHDLYRSAAFDRSSQGRRRRWYQRIAGKLALDAGDQVDDVSTELAYYFEQAGMPAVAAQYCAVAGERAARQFAHSEALGQFRRGLDLLKSVSAPNERDAIELRVQVGLADLLVALQGHRSHEVVAALSRARELNEKLGDAPQSFAALRGLYELLIGRPDYEGTLEVCDKTDRVARRENDSYVVAEALRLRGLSTFFLGRLRESQKALAESIAAYNRGAPTSKVCGIGKEPLATSASVLALASASVFALVLWMLGYPEQALLSSRDALGRANAVGAPFTTAVARCFRAMLMRFLRDSTATIQEADSAIDICDRYGFSYWRAQASLERGWAIAMQGRATEGLKEMRSVLASVSLGVGGSMAKLAEACLQAGKTNQGLRTIDEALQFVLEHKEGAWEPELHRLKGELLIQRAQARAGKRSTDIEQAEHCFSTAIQRARENDAKSFELRGAMSLSRLRSRQGKRADARRIVADAYSWFTEGFNTTDLVDARRLLNQR